MSDELSSLQILKKIDHLRSHSVYVQDAGLILCKKPNQINTINHNQAMAVVALVEMLAFKKIRQSVLCNVTVLGQMFNHVGHDCASLCKKGETTWEDCRMELYL